MELKGEYLFDAPQHLVWEAVQDPRVLAMVLPSAWTVKQIAEHAYRGTMQFIVGSFTGIFTGTIQLLHVQAPNSYEALVNASASTGVIRIKGKLRLETQGEQTIMHYDGEVIFGGRIASVSSRLLEPAVISTVNQGFAALNIYLIQKRDKRNSQEISVQE